MAVVELEGGSGDGYVADVAADGALRTMPAGSQVSQGSFSVTTSSMTLVEAAPGRRQIQIQNLDDVNPIHIHLAASAAATNHLRIDPGVIYMFPPGVSYEGEIRAIAVGGSVQTAVVQFYL